MRKLYSLLLLLLCFLATRAQHKTVIQGAIVDSSTNQAMADATVSLMSLTDSSQTGYTIADSKGHFSLKNIPAGKYKLQITYTGYSIFTKDINATEAKPLIDLGTLKMNKQSDMMQEVVVTRPPILIKKDTIEFNAGSFKTKPNATVEDLLKKLPGVEVDKDGNVTNQGQQITKIYVDGKEFFSNDPKLATKNLTADMVESVQVFDDMSDQAKFTKIDDGSKQKTINIKLKKDKKKGYFGRAVAGAGSSDRYTGNLMFNDFKQNTQLSVVGGANNINVAGFTSSDMFNTGGGGNKGGGRGGGGGGNNSGSADGNTKVWNAGFNYRDKWSPKMDVSGNYFISNTENVNRSNSYTTATYADSIAYTNAAHISLNKNLNNRFGFRWEYAIDSMNSLLATPTFSTQHTENLNVDSTQTISSKSGQEYLAIIGRNNNTGSRDGWNFGNNLLYRHRFKKEGRTFTAGWNTSASANTGTSYVLSPYTFFNPDSSVQRVNNQQQKNDQKGNSNNNTVSMSFTEGLGKNKILEFNYAYTNNRNTSDKKTYDYDSVDEKFTVPNKSLTNYFENTQISHRAGTNFRLQKEAYDFQLGGAVNFSALKNNSFRLATGKDSSMNQRFVNFFPAANFNYNLGTRKSIRFSYRGNTQAPNITQLQDVIDSSNQLNIRSGNPNLKQQFTNDLSLNYNTFNVNNFVFLNIELKFTAISNKIVSSITTNADTKSQYTVPENVNGAYNTSLYVTTGIPLKKVASGKKSPMNLNLTSSARFNRDVSLLNQEKNLSSAWVVNERLNFNLNVKDKLDLGLSANFTYNTTTYSIGDQNNNKYFSYHYSVDATYTFFKTFLLSSDFDYFINAGLSSGYNKNIPLWNASIAKQVFKKKNGEIRFAVCDILNQNQSISRTANNNYIRDTRTEVLQRFFMVSVLYNLGRFGGKGSMMNGGGGRGNGGSFHGGRSRN